VSYYREGHVQLRVQNMSMATDDSFTLTLAVGRCVPLVVYLVSCVVGASQWCFASACPSSRRMSTQMLTAPVSPGPFIRSGVWQQLWASKSGQACWRITWCSIGVRPSATAGLAHLLRSLACALSPFSRLDLSQHSTTNSGLQHLAEDLSFTMWRSGVPS
jgi:hypothetical protein